MMLTERMGVSEADMDELIEYLLADDEPEQ